MARRIAGSKINWTALAERVPPNQRPSFLSFKSRSDGYLRRMLQNPECPPAINWADYEGKIPIPGLVADFKKCYEALNIPYPKDTKTAEIDTQETEVKAAIAAFIASSQKAMENSEQEMKRELSKISYSEMTMEEFFQAHPEHAIDTYNKPTFWPHEPEDQLGYVEKDAPPKEAH